MANLQISLDDSTQKLALELMQSGQYNSLDDLVARALITFQELLAQSDQEIDKELQIGIRQIENDDTVLYDRKVFFDAYRERRHQGLTYSSKDSAALPPIAD